MRATLGGLGHPAHLAVATGLEELRQPRGGRPGLIEVGEAAEVEAEAAGLGADQVAGSVRSRDRHNAGPASAPATGPAAAAETPAGISASCTRSSPKRSPSTARRRNSRSPTGGRRRRSRPATAAAPPATLGLKEARPCRTGGS